MVRSGRSRLNACCARNAKRQRGARFQPKRSNLGDGEQMVNIPVLGGAPVAFTADGNQREIPLSQLYFDSNGNINATSWPLYSTYQSIVDPWLAYLVGQKLLTPGAVPAAKPALAISAREGGAAGNAVSVTFANPMPNADPKAATVDITVSAIQNWSLLRAENLESILGTGPGTGSQPGLVFLKPPAPNAGTMPRAGTVAAAGTPPELAIKKQGSGTAFTLKPLFDGPDPADAALLTVTVKDVDTTNNSFSLVANWTKSKTGVSLQDLLDPPHNPFAYLVNFAAPSGGLIGPPNAGTITLQGGADSRTAPSVTATATALMG
jgi:hypothetical protein